MNSFCTQVLWFILSRVVKSLVS